MTLGHSDASRPSLIIAILNAIDAAEQGKVAAGYSALLVGLERVQQAADAGEAWAAPEVSRWQLALDRYCELFGVKY